MYDFIEIPAEIEGKCKYYGDDCKKSKDSHNPLAIFP